MTITSVESGVFQSSPNILVIMGVLLLFSAGAVGWVFHLCFSRKRAARQRGLVSDPYRVFFESVPGGAYLSTSGGKLTDCNTGLAKILGYDTREQLLACLSEPEIYADPEYRRSLIQELSEKENIRNRKVRIRRRDGAEVMLVQDVLASFRPDGAIDRVQCVLFDFTESERTQESLRRAEQQIIQNEKMSAIGQMISGVAHELNNPLTAIVGYSQLLETATSEDMPEYALKIYRQAKRVHKLVQNLLSFSRQNTPLKQSVDLRNVIEDLLALKEFDLETHCIVVEKHFESVPEIQADPYQLEQVFLNIANNAIDAMLEKGSGGRLEVLLYSSDSHAVVEFHDTGTGIKDTSRVFDPFYTTKKIGKGTGLGLSICYGIVKEHGGEISAANEPGGAVFQVKLPTQSSLSTAVPPEQILRQETLINVRIALFDAEESLLEFQFDALKGAGANVTAVPNGEGMLAILQNGETFDAIVLDGHAALGGIASAVIEWIRGNRDEWLNRVLVTVPVQRSAVDYEQLGVATLNKPFQLRDLISAVRKRAIESQVLVENQN